jgi:hypothetical protein
LSLAVYGSRELRLPKEKEVQLMRQIYSKDIFTSRNEKLAAKRQNLKKDPTTDPPTQQQL